MQSIPSQGYTVSLLHIPLTKAKSHSCPTMVHLHVHWYIQSFSNQFILCCSVIRCFSNYVWLFSAVCVPSFRVLILMPSMYLRIVTRGRLQYCRQTSPINQAAFDGHFFYHHSSSALALCFTPSVPVRVKVSGSGPLCCSRTQASMTQSGSFAKYYCGPIQLEQVSL